MELKEFQKIYANHIIGGCGCPDYHRSTTLGLVRNLDRDDIDPAVPTLPVIVGMPLTFNIADGLTMKLILIQRLKSCVGERQTWDGPSTY